METKKIKEVEQFIQSKLDEVAKTRKTWEDLLQSAKDQQEKAAEETAKTYAEADVKSYHRAQDAYRTATDAIAMYEGKLQALDEEQLITSEEFNTYYDGVVAELDSVNMEAKTKIIKIIDEQIAPIVEQTSAVIGHTNELLKTLQLSFLKDHRAEEIPTLLRTYSDHSVSGYMNFLRGSTLYQKTKGVMS